MKKFVIGLLVIVFIGILAYCVINNDRFLKKNLNCEDFSHIEEGKIDCSYLLVDAGMTVKAVSLKDVFLKDGKYYLGFYRYSDSQKKKIIEEKMVIGKSNEGYKTIQFQIQNDRFLYPISDHIIINIPMTPEDF